MASPSFRVLFENEAVLALDKPAGVSMATSAREGKSEAEVVARLLSACGVGEASGAPPPGLRLVHRLDVGTSGVVLLAKDAAAHRALTRAFQEREAEKTYRALVWGRPVPAQGLLDAPLGRDRADGRRMAARADGKPSRTRYETLRRLASCADLRLSPETGRTHQIRVHLSGAGHPIVGDDLYGGATRWRGVRDGALRDALRRVARPLLHAERVAVPALGLDVAAPLPDDFAAALRALEAAPSAR